MRYDRGDEACTMAGRPCTYSSREFAHTLPAGRFGYCNVGQSRMIEAREFQRASSLSSFAVPGPVRRSAHLVVAWDWNL
jgi:hypothetical protein